MTWYPDHPGGCVKCDQPGCTRTRRNYCTPQERDEWVAFQCGNSVLDFCPTHRGDQQSNPSWLTATKETGRD